MYVCMYIIVSSNFISVLLFFLFFFYILKCLYLFLKIYCSINGLQHCVSSRCIAK